MSRWERERGETSYKKEKGSREMGKGRWQRGELRVGNGLQKGKGSGEKEEKGNGREKES